MARVTVKALEERIAALEARLEIARRVYRDQRERIGELEAALNTRGVKPCAFQRKVTEFTRRDGSRWVKEIVAPGRAVIRPAATEEVV
jgi:BMFP domain-containing protein YqiC